LSFYISFFVYLKFKSLIVSLVWQTVIKSISSMPMSTRAKPAYT